jgi:hypothetical protein
MQSIKRSLHTEIRRRRDGSPTRRRPGVHCLSSRSPHGAIPAPAPPQATGLRLRHASGTPTTPLASSNTANPLAPRAARCPPTRYRTPPPCYARGSDRKLDAERWDDEALCLRLARPLSVTLCVCHLCAISIKRLEQRSRAHGRRAGRQLTRRARSLQKVELARRPRPSGGAQGTTVG